MRSTSSTTRTRSAASSGSTWYRCYSRSVRSSARWLAVVCGGGVSAAAGRRSGCPAAMCRSSAYLRWPVMFVLIIVGTCGALPLRAEPAAGEVAMDQRRQRVRGLAWLGVSSLFSWYLGNFRQLQRHLWRARRGGRPDDVDVASTIVVLVGADIQFRDRAPDRARFDHRRGQADGHARRGHGRHGGRRDGVDSRNCRHAGSAGYRSGTRPGGAGRKSKRRRAGRTIMPHDASLCNNFDCWFSCR